MFRTPRSQHARAKSAAIIAAIGLALTLFTSWLPILWAQFTPFGNLAPNLKIFWPAKPLSDWPETPDALNISSGCFGIDVTIASHNVEQLAATKRSDPSVIAHSMILREYGFPFRSCQTLQLIVQAGKTITTPQTSIWTQGMKMPPRFHGGSGHKEFFPIMPIWTGFLANWLMYSSCTYLLSKYFRIYLSKRRRQQGRCVSCGYPVSQLPTCPECGTPTKLP